MQPIPRTGEIILRLQPRDNHNFYDFKMNFDLLTPSATGDECRQDCSVEIARLLFSQFKRCLPKVQKKNRIGPIMNYIFVFHLGTRMKIPFLDQTTTDEVLDYVLKTLGDDFDEVYLTYNEKPIRRGFTLKEFGIPPNVALNVRSRLVGGSKIYLPTYSIVEECEKALSVALEREENCKTVDDPLSAKLLFQSADEPEPGMRWQDKRIFYDAAMKFVRTQTKNLPKIDGSLSWYIEAIYSARKIAYSNMSNYDKFMACCLLLTRKSTSEVTQLLLSTLSTSEMEFQSDDSFTFEDVFEKFDAVKSHPLAQKLIKALSYLSIVEIASKFGCSCNTKEVLSFIEKFTRNPSGLTSCLLDLAVEFVKRIGQVWRTGKLDSFFHSADTYGVWEEKFQKLKRWSMVSTNPEPHGFSYFQYIAELNDAIETGRAIYKAQIAQGVAPHHSVKKWVNELELISALELTKRSAQTTRMAPFGVLVYGLSSIAKSQFTDLLFHYYGNLFDRPTDPEYRYVRNPADPYWTNFNTSKWCIHLDDIAFLKPNITSQGDPSILEMLQIFNNIPFVPVQADLADKGRTPCRAELVTASTNQLDLNASAYFNCPLAVQRRMPYVIKLSVKSEYRQHDSHMIDPQLMTSNGDGVYPDYWDVVVCRVTPHKGDPNMACLTESERYHSIYEFLKDFGENCRQHKMNQLQAMAGSEYTRNISVCKKCMIPTIKCDCLEEQATVQEELVALAPWRTTRRSTTRRVLDKCYELIYTPYVLFCIWLLSLRIMHLALSNSILRPIVLRYLMPHIPLRQQGTVWERYFTHPKQHIALAALSTACVCVSMYAYSVMSEKEKQEVQASEDQKNPEEQRPSEKDDHVDQQFKKEKAQNVWYNDSIHIEEFHVPVASRSHIADYDKFTEILSRNVARVQIRNGTGKVVTTSVVFIKGNYALINNHALKGTIDDYMFTLIFAPRKGVTPNFQARVTQINRMPTQDLAVVHVPGCPPRADITKYWAQSSLSQSVDGSYVMRTNDGEIIVKRVRSIEYWPSIQLNMESGHVAAYMGVVDEPSQVGDCGSPLVVRTSFGPTICGIHVAGKDRRVSALVVEKSFLELSVTLLERQTGFMAFEPNPPLIGSTLAPRTLDQTIHANCTLRWIEEGSAHIYGTLSGFRTRPRSKVMETSIKKDVETAFQVELDYGKPVMAGWEPWHNNVKHMVSNDTKMNENILDECAKAFLADISKAFGDKELNLHVLTNRQAVNGIEGVKFIDKINRNSSMGFPWNTKKTNYLVPLNDGTTDVDFPEEIWGRVDNIIENYHNNRRASPVFTGSLKDIPTSRAHIDVKKTRMFAAAPVDWSIVVRKYLLSFTKLVQENMYIFEAAPGTVTQSIQWTNHYNYVTQFGKDRMVAGDYSAYDKRMQALIILKAFWIIEQVHIQQGWTKSACQIIQGIAYDTAFSFVDFNGTLLEFFGTNPSGHPLTVIINSLVNSLYMRYSYVVLNPAMEAKTFKQNVALLTYGDDNMAGVSTAAPWFNHTAISAVLAEIGVVYTMADKESESVPFISIDDTSFLKRKWVWCEELGAMLAPLEKNSILKSLAYKMANGLSESADYTARFKNVLLETFFHGREEFSRMMEFLKYINHREDLLVEDSVFKDWDHYKMIFLSKENNFSLLSFGHGLAHEFANEEWEYILPADTSD